MAFSERSDWEGIWVAAGDRERKNGLMPQVQLPIFPVGTSVITPELGFERREQQVVYLNGHLPVFTHEVSDLASFRLFTTQLIVNGTASQGQIAKAFGVPLTTIKRYCRQYRERGAAAFFKPAVRRRGHRLTPEGLEEVQGLLNEGQSVPQISQQTGLLASTLHKAIDGGRLRQIKKKSLVAARLSQSAARPKVSAASPMRRRLSE